MLSARNQTDSRVAPKIKPRPRESMLELQKNSRFAQLPEDLLRLIMDHLRKGQKVNVIKTCRHLHHLLEVALYIHLSPIDPWNARTSGLLHRTLAGRTDLIHCIRSYCGFMLPAPLEPISKPNILVRSGKRMLEALFGRSVNDITETERFKTAVFVFSNATNIVILEFTDGYDWISNPIFEPIRVAVSKMSLIRLRLEYGSHPTSVLRAQPELEHLEVGLPFDGFSALEQTDLLKLRSLKASLENASLIVPGRPIEQLDLTSEYPGEHWDEERFKRLTQSTRPITKLSIYLYRPWEARRTRTNLQLISRHLRRLEQLTIFVCGWISEQTILDEIPWFPSIRKVVFVAANLAASHTLEDSNDPSHSRGIGWYTHAWGDWDDLTTRLKILCPLLADVEHTRYLTPVRQHYN